MICERARRSLNRPLGAGAALLSLVAACQLDPHTLTYARARPERLAIVGKWTATESTLHDLSHSAYSKARPTIEVSGNGAIRMADNPDAWRSSSKDESGRLEQFVGTWELSKHRDKWWGLRLRDGNWGCDGCLMVVGQRPPYTLLISAGDPDSGDGYEFEKTR